MKPHAARAHKAKYTKLSYHKAGSDVDPCVALWSAVLAEASCTWLTLHPGYCRRPAKAAWKGWREADDWLFGRLTGSLELACLAAGLDPDGLRRGLRRTLYIAKTPKKQSVMDRMDWIRWLGLSAGSAFTNILDELDQLRRLGKLKGGRRG